MRTIRVLGRRLYNRHLKNGLPSCLNHCAWPRALPEPVSPSVSFVSTLPSNNPRDGLCFNVLNKGVQESWNADLTLLFPFCSKRNETGVKVCYSFYQELGSIFLCFFFWNHVKKATIVCWKTVMLPKFGGVMMSAGVCHRWRKHCWMYTWWIKAINVKYASAAKAASVSFSFRSVETEQF